MNSISTILILLLVLLSCSSIKNSQKESLNENVDLDIVPYDYNIKYTVNGICDSIKSIPNNIDNINQVSLEQIEIALWIAGKNALRNDPLINNPEFEFNTYFYRVSRELIKSCPEYEKKNFFILPFEEGILDVERAFSQKERDSISYYIKRIKETKKVDLAIISIDEVYPYQTMKEYAVELSNNWYSGLRNNGKILFVFSKTLREGRIWNTNGAQYRLNENESEEIMEKIIVKNFKKGNYYDGIINMINEIESKI